MSLFYITNYTCEEWVEKYILTLRVIKILKSNDSESQNIYFRDISEVTSSLKRL
jgi:hypothetical protein